MKDLIQSETPDNQSSKYRLMLLKDIREQSIGGRTLKSYFLHTYHLYASLSLKNTSSHLNQSINQSPTPFRQSRILISLDAHLGMTGCTSRLDGMYI